ncbi:MAG TPA: peptidoglycan-binding protein [Gaiellaceae bacterium]|nr:peptidoglycan-binding protein [Gaiellaceae bacterium]
MASLIAALVFAAPAHAFVPRACAVQVALKAHGFYKGPVDGIAGPQTQRGIRRFQHRKGLVVDGVAGPHTRAKLGRLGRPRLGRRLVHRGMVGWDVSVVQALLTRKGVRTGGLDGIFGAHTRRAVLAFQRRRGLVVDGVVGPSTIRALRTRGGRARHRLPHASPESISRSLDYWSRRYGVSRSLVRAVAWMESGFQNDVVSSTGAFGVMQIMPDTWKFVEQVLLGRRVPRTAHQNVRVGVLYLRHLLRHFAWNKRLALAGWYQGPAAVERHGLYRETRSFVRVVLALQRQM